MIRRWLALTYYLYALRLAALSHFYFNPLYLAEFADIAEADKHRRAAPEGKTPAEHLAYQLGWTGLLLQWERDEQAGQTVHTPAEGYKWNDLGGLYQQFYRQYGSLSLRRRKPDCVSRLPKSAHGWRRCQNRSYLSPTSADGQTTRQNGRSGNGCTSIRLRRLPTSARTSANGKSRICMARHML